VSSINRFPWQDEILRGLHTGEASSIDDLADVVATEGHESVLLREEIAQNIDHLVHLGPAEYAGGDGSRREVRLTQSGAEAAASLP
jgi:hypothetical protein